MALLFSSINLSSSWRFTAMIVLLGAEFFMVKNQTVLMRGRIELHCNIVSIEKTSCDMFRYLVNFFTIAYVVFDDLCRLYYAPREWY